MKSVTDPRGATSYTYDGQGREETVTTSGGVTRKTYYPDGLVKDITFPNGTKRAHGYDKADRLLTIVTTKDEAAVASTAYTYDPNGNRLTQVQTNGGTEETTTYTYDDLDRLATVTYAAGRGASERPEGDVRPRRGRQPQDRGGDGPADGGRARVEDGPLRQREPPHRAHRQPRRQPRRRRLSGTRTATCSPRRRRASRRATATTCATRSPRWSGAGSRSRASWATSTSGGC